MSKAELYKHSVQIGTENCEYLFLSMKNFHDKFFSNDEKFRQGCEERIYAKQNYRADTEELRT